MKQLIDKLHTQKHLSKDEYVSLFSSYTPSDIAYAATLAQDIKNSVYGKNVFIRGLIEISSYCKNDCYYCGICRSNKNAQRYRLSKEEILDCCHSGYIAGFRTFVMQGGEDPWYTDDIMADIISAIRTEFPDCAITLSLGEKEHDSYERFFRSGANRYLLRHETADAAHYQLLHPKTQTLAKRMECLWDLKRIGYQVGCGFMIGSPGQTPNTLAEDFLFLEKFQPHMVGMGPFLPHKHTVFRDHPGGSVDLTLFLLSLCRILLPKVLLPATTALSTANADGKLLGVLHGANVVMPNLSPWDKREKYMLYDNKFPSGKDPVAAVRELSEKMATIDHAVVIGRGDHLDV